MPQRNLFGDDVPPDGIVERIELVLESDPETRNRYKALMAQYWYNYDGLDQFMDEETFQRFRRWFTGKATHPKTIQNRAMEIQRANRALDSNPFWREIRDKQGTQGRVT